MSFRKQKQMVLAGMQLEGATFKAANAEMSGAACAASITKYINDNADKELLAPSTCACCVCLR